MKLQSNICLPLILIALIFSGCTTIHPKAVPEAITDKQLFTHERFDRVLQRYGSESGKIDYAALQKNPDELNRYYRLLTQISPDSHPELFPTDDHKLAYWINAYNAAAINIVLTYYPIKSVKEVKPPAVFFFLPVESGFFVFQKPVFGGRTISLYSLENGIVRKRFAEPRIHFALNCASIGCPRLPQTPFLPDKLDEQLDTETRRFMAEERNVRIDHDNRTVFISQIFQWFEDDFIDWLKHHHPELSASLPGYIALYLDGEKASEWEKISTTYRLEFIPYDWQLNDLQQ
jgi:hypothetical protein